MTTALVRSAKAIASLSSLEPPAGHRLSGLTAGEDIFAGAACNIQDDGLVYRAWATAADQRANVFGWSWRSVKAGGAITLGFHERMHMFDTGDVDPGAPLYLSDDAATKGSLQLTPGLGSPLPIAFAMEDGVRIYCLQSVGQFGVAAGAAAAAELALFLANVPQANVPVIALVDATDDATVWALVNALKASYNILIGELVAAKILAAP